MPSRLSRPARLTLLCLASTAAVGLLATVYALLRADAVVRPTASLVTAAALVAGCTFANLLVRFLRWHFLLRRLGVRQATMPSLTAWVASFVALPVPLYLGHLYARTRLLELDAGARARVRTAFLWEQAGNAWALAVLALAMGRMLSTVLAIALSAALVVPPFARRAAALSARAAGRLGLLLEGEAVPATEDVAGVLAEPGHVLVHLGLSLLAWLPIALALAPLAWTLGATTAAPGLVGAAADATLVGAASMVPVGAGVAGLRLLDDLGRLGVAPATAAQAVFVFRVATAWLSVTLGAVAMALLPGVRRRTATHDHFDAIDACYDAWLPEHYRAHLVRRKTEPIIAELGTLPRGARGLDIGCGRGWYLASLRAAGARMAGVDTSGRQLAAAAQYLGGDVPLAQASVLGLPFAAATFDFAYVINVLHHVAPPAAQRSALAEIARVVRPGGLVFVHEMNVRNPLFRFYLGYVFPILKGIEEGTEYYLDARAMHDLPALRLRSVRHFTFVPDFVPEVLLPAMTEMERRLEAGPLAPYAAHFVAVFERR